MCIYIILNKTIKDFYSTKIDVAWNDFKYDVERLPFYKSEVIQKVTSKSAIVDCAVGMFVSQSTENDKKNLGKMYEQDLQYLDQFNVATDTLTLLALLAARSLINLYCSDLLQRLNHLLRPTDTERRILWTVTEKPESAPDSIARDELAKRRCETVKMVLEQEYEKFLNMVTSLYLQFKAFKMHLRGCDEGGKTICDFVPAEIYEKKHMFYEMIFKKSGKTKSDVPSVYVLQRPKNAGAAGLNRPAP